MVLNKLKCGYALLMILTLCTVNILMVDRCLFSVMERPIPRESEKLIYLQHIVIKRRRKLKQHTYKELWEKHFSMYDGPTLRLWARMISFGLYEVYYEPSDVWAFSGNGCKRPRRDSLSDSLRGAAVAFANALNKGNSTDRDKHSTPSTTVVVSSSQAIELRM